MRTGATRSHAQGARDRAWRAWRGPEWSGRAAAPKAGLKCATLPGLILADQQACVFPGVSAGAHVFVCFLAAVLERSLSGAAVGGGGWAGMSRLRSFLARFTGAAKPMAAGDEAAQLRDMRAVAVGALGEALVRAELEVLGWPMLRNVILGAPSHRVEIDQLARAPGGVIVLETKTYSGHVDGDPGSEFWILSLRDGRSFVVPNAVRQNVAHIRAVRCVIDDASVPVRGYVVSAGAGRFAPQLARAIVPAAELRTRLAGDAALQRRGGVKLEAAWSRLVAAAAEGETHRAAHATRRPAGADGRMPPSF